MTEEDASQGKSILWIAVAASVLTLVCGWGFLAGSYVGSHTKAASELTPEERDALYKEHSRHFDRYVQTNAILSIVPFVSNAVTQLPNMPAVISWNLSNRLWLPVLIIALEAGVIGGALGLRRLERRLSRPPPRRKKRRSSADQSSKSTGRRRKRRRRRSGDDSAGHL